jgi:hypothetical protein
LPEIKPFLVGKIPIFWLPKAQHSLNRSTILLLFHRFSPLKSQHHGQDCVVIMGSAGDIDEDLLLESGDGSPEKVGKLRK